jgi:hypothetical protein
MTPTTQYIVFERGSCPGPEQCSLASQVTLFHAGSSDFLTFVNETFCRDSGRKFFFKLMNCKIN